MQNSKSINSNTGYKGITFVKDRGLFQAQVVVYSTKKKVLLQIILILN